MKRHPFFSIIPLIIVAIGFALRLHALDSESLWYDELLQLDIAQDPFSSIIPQLWNHAAVPLDYWLVHFWVSLGRSEMWVRLPAVILGTLTLPMAYQLGRKLVDRRVALLFMAFLAVSPFHIHYSQEVRPYALLFLGILVAGYGYWQLRKRDSWQDRALLLMGVLIFSLAHFFAIVIFIPWGIFGLLDILFGENRTQALKAFVALGLSGFIALVILLSYGWGNTLWNVSWWGFGRAAVIEQEQFTVAPAEKPNRGSGPRVTWVFIRYDILSQLGAGEARATLWLFNGLAGLGALYLLIQKRYKSVLYLLLWLFVPVITILLFLIQRGEFFASRYILSVLPAYLLLIAVGSFAIPRWLMRGDSWLSTTFALIISLFVFIDLGAALNQFYDQQSKEDWRLTSQVIAQNAQPEHGVIAVNAESTLNWYYPQAAVPPDTFNYLVDIQAQAALAERNWIIMSIFTQYLGDEDDKIKAWLSEQGAIRLDVDPLIDIYYVGQQTSPDQLLAEIQTFALPPNHELYASLARENRRKPDVARQYYQLAIQYAPTEQLRSEYQTALETIQ
ncbi:MAG: glycosyltransferase family 39 protein [Chloroflexota bacterium]